MSAEEVTLVEALRRRVNHLDKRVNTLEEQLAAEQEKREELEEWVGRIARRVER